MGLPQRGNESKMMSEKKKLRTERKKKSCEKEEKRGYQRKGAKNQKK